MTAQPSMLPQVGSELDTLAINTIRCLAIDAVERANSGHPGLPMGAAPMAYALWTRFLRHDPGAPGWADRDRFILSAGHGSMLLYALLHLSGYGLALEELQQFRQWGARAAGHPERGLVPGIEVTTGPLGQGFGNGVGMAIAERFQAHRYNRDGEPIVDHRTFVLCSDGDLMEGVASEAASLAGHLGLGKLVCLYDDNRVSLDGPTSLAFTEDVGARFAAYGWHVQRVEDGETDLAGITDAIQRAIDTTDRPSLISIRTIIGYGAPGKEGTSQAHGSPLGPAQARLAKAAYGFDPDQAFVVPAEVAGLFAETGRRGAGQRRAWEERFASWGQRHPELRLEFEQAAAGALPDGWDAGLPTFAPADGPLATRVAGGRALTALAAAVPWLLGGDADLSESTKTAIPDGGAFDGQTGAGRNLHFGVREHAMGAACNGMAAHGGVRPYSATFFVFSDYQRPSVRLAALSELPVVFVYTHDSIGLGEDGPTHQPIEHLASLRLMPGLDVYRPGDANETSAVWRAALRRGDGPTVVVLSRQNLPIFEETAALATGAGVPVERGAYVLQEATGGSPRCLLLASGSEVGLAVEARRTLEAQGVPTRVVSVPSLDRFTAQPQGYRDAVLPPTVTVRVAVEAAVPDPWYRWVGAGGVVIGIERFGASAPAPEIYQHLGVTAAAVVSAAERQLRG
ncbi:MAG TPA: transketolase [Candidatus Dormibacteraeota bacterium]|nr:transketolase [Candidatus Dormibacteraeota bacterium]